MVRSSRGGRKDVLKIFAKFTGKHLCQSLFFNKVAGLRPTSVKTRLWHKCFPVSFAKFLRRSFLTEHFRWLLLDGENSAQISIAAKNMVTRDDPEL